MRGCSGVSTLGGGSSPIVIAPIAQTTQAGTPDE